VTWLRNPWGRPRFLFLFTLAYMTWSIVPVLLAVRFAFNDGRSRSTAQGWSTRWFWDEPDLSVRHDPALRGSLFQSLELAAIAMAVAVPLGVGLALALARWRGIGARPARFTALLPIVTPEIVMGTALFLTFIHLLRFVELGTQAQAIGHVTFSLPFVVIVVLARLLSLGREYEEAARDLGASALQAVRYVVLPLLTPAIVAGFLVVFAISIDDFVITAFLSSDASTETIPVKIYANARGAPTPALNALATVMLFLTIFMAAVGYLLYRVVRRTYGGRDVAAMGA
jgi:spermidine/putrescine transport system permease protein